ncbi:ABC transporter permease [Brucepastera parasyntrophica]|uniref:ABC transporter permease n=1 Tax=Brucepastera parasyntrophica TaxID=2880008 RepID=UPI00210C9A86|nr:ABC transporter permease [Brucepastera parasyntrophica]ULQ60041.1 ABC transporter permease [Brucepastera parasyntrophica]
MGEKDNWTTIIKPEHKLIDLRIRELIRYRDLVFLFFKRDFTTQYKQTILGPLWYVIQPLISTIMYTFVFGNLANISTEGVPHILFYFGGTMLWTFFEKCFKDSSDTFTSNADIFGKVYFPRLTVPISRVLINAVGLGIQFVLFIIFYVYYFVLKYPISPSWSALLFPCVVIWLAALGTGMGLIISAITTKYRDIKQLITFGISLWMYATPIVYPLSQIPEQFSWVFYINPVSAPIEYFRIIFYGTGYVPPAMFISSIVMTVVFLFFGLIFFNRGERTFIDVA